MFHVKSRSSTFEFNGKKYNYYFQEWDTERAVEIPIIWEKVKLNKKSKILELGNVFSNIYPVNHDIIDKYDNNPGLINEDVIDFKTSKRYQLIVSISTLEHVGWDETPKKPEKVVLAIEKLKNCLSEDGELIFSVPIGYNSYLDELIKKGKIPITEKYFLKKISDNQWIETNWKEVKHMKYNDPYNFANAIMIGVIKK